MFARFSYDQATSFVPGGSPGYAEAGAFASTQNITNHGRNAVISETHIFSPTNINQFTFGFNRIFNIILSFGTGQCEAQKIGIQGADLSSACGGAARCIVNQSTKDCVSCGLSSTQSDRLLVGRRPWICSFQGGTNVFSIADSLDMIRGKHDIRVGVGIRANQMNVRYQRFQDGYFLMGDASPPSGTALIVAIPKPTYFWGRLAERSTTRRYGRDDRAALEDVSPLRAGRLAGRRHNLTLNLGLAWSLATPMTEAQERHGEF